jgi:hypothetical protein
MNRLVILLVLACGAISAHAATKDQVYKWTDANGVVHYSDAPPPKDALDVKSVHIVGDTTAEAPRAAASEDKAKPASASTAPANAVPPPDTADVRAKECDQAKRNLALLQSPYPVSELGPDGKAQPIDDKERDARIAGVNDRIAQFCAK